MNYSTGFEVFDNFLEEKGGLKPGDFITMTSKRCSLKTTTAISLASNIIDKNPDSTILHLDLNMSTSKERVMDVTNGFYHENYIICNSIPNLLFPLEIVDCIKKTIKSKEDINVLIIDNYTYLGMNRPDSEVDDFVLRLKEVSKELNLIVINIVEQRFLGMENGKTKYDLIQGGYTVVKNSKLIIDIADTSVLYSDEWKQTPYACLSKLDFNNIDLYIKEYFKDAKHC